jgi:hypothetical protein
MTSARYLLFFALPIFSGCAAFPPGRSAVVGTYSASIGFNQGASVSLKPDGTYERSVSLFYCSPLVIETSEGREETFSGWTNTEAGTWEVSDRVVLLKAGDRHLENPNVEKEYFDDVRSYPITYKFPRGWVLVYPQWQCVVMKKEPNQSVQTTPGLRPSVSDL